MSPVTDSTTRFTGRVADYVRYRPGYPPTLISTLIDTVGLEREAVVADIGAGTGIFTRLLLEQGLPVFAVEPNAAMRAAADASLGGYPAYRGVDATAENTTLEAGSIDLITAAQAFHWFNNARALAEFRRILRPRGQLALIWNRRRLHQPLQQAYHELLLQHAPEYDKVNHMELGEDRIGAIFTPPMRQFRFDNVQQLELDELLGRLRSASYCPPESSAQYRALADGIGALFAREARAGRIDFEYDTRLYLGTPAP